MARPSLKASQQGIQLAREAFVTKGLTQVTLAARLGCHRATISKFFSDGAIWQNHFIGICKELGLDWQEIAVLPQTLDQELAESSSKDDVDVTTLVQEVRSKVKASIQEWCGTMRILDMTQPIELSKIYTNVNVLEKIAANRRKTILELCKELHLEDWEDFERLGLGRVVEERVSGLKAVEKYKKLIVLGKPGAGKTTFLKHLAIECNEGRFKPNLVPIFISLKYFAEALAQPTLLEYIEQQFSGCGVNLQELEELLKQKSVLLLLDGLDEIREENQQRTFHQIREISRIYHSNYLILSCRIAAKEYDVFDKFTEVEIADFDSEQIETFSKNWFANKSVKSEDFLKSLKVIDRSYQLAVTPLLLTLLCLVFENSGYLPHSRSTLYIEGIQILLKKWDAQRGIQREQAYKELSPLRKFDLLSEIGFTTFKENQYFFTIQDVKETIEDFFKKIHRERGFLFRIQENEVQADSETLDILSAIELDIESVLKSIEAQHGLLIERARNFYSFSHLTFHEYFAAWDIVIRQRPQKKALETLLKHLSEKRWREVFLLATEMSQPDASMLLEMMKSDIDKMLAENEHLQKFLKDIDEQSKSHELSIEPAAVRAFYFDIDFDIDQERRLSLRIDPSANYLVCGSFFARVLENTSFEVGIRLAKSYDDNNVDKFYKKICEASSANEVMYIAVKYALESDQLKSKLREALEKLYKEDSRQIENDELDEEKLKHLADGSRSIAKRTHQIGSKSWQFSNNERKLLRQYYEANTLLLECLNTECAVKPKVRQEILETLLLPISNRNFES